MKNKRVMLKKAKKMLAIALAGIISFGNIVPSYAATTPNHLNVTMTGVFYSYDSNGNQAGLNKMGIFKSGNSDFKAVYCGEHSIMPPMNEGETKSLPIEKYNSHDDIRKALYYGYGGPEEWSGFSKTTYNSPYKLFSGNAAKTKTEACGRAVTATALTKAYRNHGGKGHVYDVSGLSAFESFIGSKPAPPSSFEVYRMPSNAGGVQDLFTWRYSPEGTLKLIKTGNDSDGIVGKYPDSYSLAGAKYKVYSDSSLNNYVGTLTTTSDGSSNTITVNEGTYYVKETVAPKGYSLDNIIHKIYVSSGKSAILRVSDNPKSGRLSLTKAVAKNNHIVNMCPEMYNLKGAKYNVYEYTTQKYVGTLVTDENGETNSLSVPEGKYFAKEIEAPYGFYLNHAPTAPVTVANGGSAVIETEDTPGIDPMSIKLKKVIEEGADKNLSVEGAEYTVRYYKGFYYTIEETQNQKAFKTWVFKTDKNGLIQMRDKWLVKDKSDELIYDDDGIPGGPLGTYTIEETKAPKGLASSGYVDIQQIKLNNHSNVIEVNKDVTDIEKSQTVSLTVNKVDKETGKNVPQGFGSLAGAEYEVNYYDPLTGEDTKAGTIITDENGHGTLTGLKPGLYKIREIKAPKGYVANTEEIKVEARVKELNTANFNYTVKSEETPHKTVINKSYIIDGSRNNLEDAVLQIIDSKGTVLTEFTTTEEDVVIKALPDGKYTLHEVSAPEGFVISPDITFEVKEGVVENKVSMEDDYTKVDLSKRAITGSDELPGATLELLKGDEVIDEWVSGDKPYRINMLPVGEYILRETIPADGYVTANDITFTVENTGEVQTVIMKDELTKVDISKTDIVTGAEIEGAELSIYPVDSEGNVLEGECFETWITDGSPHRVEGLTIGKYILREKLAGATELGYVTAKDVPFEIIDTMEIQKVEMKDDFTKTEFIKLDTEGNFLDGATLSIVPIDENGKPKYGEVFKTWVTVADNPETDINEAAERVDYLPVGKYILVEDSAPDGYVKATPVPFEVKDTGELQSYSMTDKQITAVKVEKESGEPLLNAILKVVDENGEIIDRWKTDASEHFINGLSENETYTLIEEEAPVGYATANPIKFTVDEKKESITITMEDDAIKVEIIKLDKENNKPLSGAVFELTDKEGKLVRKWTSTEDAEKFEKLPIGKYTLKEVHAPKGYEKMKDQTFEVKDTDKVQKFIAVNKLIPIAHDYPQTGDTNNIALWAGVLILAGTAIVAIRVLDKRKELKDKNNK